MLILGWEGVVDYTDKANEQETSKGQYLKKSLQNGGNWNFFQVSSDSNLTFWHIILFPQTTLHTAIYYCALKKGSKSVWRYIA